MNSITVRHNMEVAHRLSQTPGKCENIHGHSMWVEFTLYGEVDPSGKLGGLDFSGIKQQFRKFLDTEFDHHLLLYEKDRLVSLKAEILDGIGEDIYPGAVFLDRDPTTENLASIVCEWAKRTFHLGCHVRVHETGTNSATADTLNFEQAVIDSVRSAERRGRLTQ